MDCSPLGSSVHGILQARILEWVAMSFSRGSSWPRDRTQVSCSSCTASRFFTAEPPGKRFHLPLGNGKQWDTTIHLLEWVRSKTLARMWSNRNLFQCWWKSKISGTLEHIWQLLTKLTIDLLYDLSIMFPSSCPTDLKAYDWTKPVTQMFIAALSIITQNLNKPKRSAVGEWVNKL